MGGGDLGRVEGFVSCGNDEQEEIRTRDSAGQAELAAAYLVVGYSSSDCCRRLVSSTFDFSFKLLSSTRLARCRGRRWVVVWSTSFVLSC